MQPDAHQRQEPVHVSPWTLRERIGRALWMLIQATVFRWSPHNAYRWRSFLLRCFGAKIDANVRIRPTVRIEIPWNLTIGTNSAVGDFAILYCLGKVTLGRHVTISQYAHLCAGTHDYTTLQMPLIRAPITIGDDAWIGADAFVGPGVTVGELCVLGARSSAFKDLPPRQVCTGSPARPIKERVLR